MLHSELTYLKKVMILDDIYCSALYIFEKSYSRSCENALKFDKFSFYLNLVAASRNCQANRCSSIRNLSSKSQIVLFSEGMQ